METNFYTYDQGELTGGLYPLFFQSAAVSDQVNKLESEVGQNIRDHYQNIRRLVKLYKARSPDGHARVIFPTSEGDVGIDHLGSYLNIKMLSEGADPAAVFCDHFSSAVLTDQGPPPEKYWRLEFEDAQKPNWKSQIADLVTREKQVLSLIDPE